MISGPAVSSYEGLILDPCIMYTKNTHKKEKCGLKSLGTTRSIIVNNYTQKNCISINQFSYIQRGRYKIILEVINYSQ